MIVTDKYHLYDRDIVMMDFLTVKLKVEWKKAVRLDGIVPRVVTVPKIKPINIMANGTLKVRVKFYLDKDSLLEYKLSCGELPKTVKMIYEPLPNDSHWRKLSVNWDSIYDTEIIVKRD